MRTLTLLALLIAATLSAHAETVFNLRATQDPSTFDWHLASAGPEVSVFLNTMEGLVGFNPQMKSEPRLAKSWTISDDRLRYTFKLRPGVVWSDGVPLTAQHFIDSWKRFLSPLTAASYSYILFDIEGAEDFNAKRIYDFNKVGVKALDDFTIEIRLRRPVAYFLQILSVWGTFPIRQDLLLKYGSTWAHPGNVAVLGPFIPVSYQPQQSIRLKRNPKYYGAAPKLDGVVFKIVNQDTTALNLFKSGALDYTRPINLLEMGDLKKSPAFQSTTYYRSCYISINTTKYPLNLPKFRQALALAVDRSALPQVLHSDIKAAFSVVHPALLEESEKAGLPFDPVRARKLLDEVGINPKTLPPLEFLAWESDESALLLTYLQDQIKKNLGIRVETKLLEYRTFRTHLELGTAPLYYRCWTADYADPDTYLSLFLATSKNGRTNWKNAEYDELVKRGSALPDGSARVQTYLKALEILLNQQSVVVPLYYDRATYLLNPKAKGFFLSPIGHVYFKNIEMMGKP